MEILLRVAYSSVVLLVFPFAALYSVASAFVGAVEGAAQLIWDCWTS
jgi:hypothetical protein